MVLRLAGSGMDGLCHGKHSCPIGHEFSGKQIFATIDPVRHNPTELPRQTGTVKLDGLFPDTWLDFMHSGNVHVAFHDTERLFFRVNNEQKVFW